MQVTSVSVTIARASIAGGHNGPARPPLYNFVPFSTVKAWVDHIIDMWPRHQHEVSAQRGEVVRGC